MIRVAFLINFNYKVWFGGTNLIKNLIYCIQKYSKNKFQPILIVRKSLKSKDLKEFKGIKVIKSDIFDQNLYTDWWLQKLKDNNVEIHARSVFLQGLLLMPINSIPAYFLPITEKIELFSKSAKELSLSKLELALGYVLGINEIDKIVVGVNTIGQLREIIEVEQIKINPMEFTDLSINNPIYTNPSLWQI